MTSTDSSPLNSYRDIRVLVTGATGFIGRWVARALTAAGAQLWTTTHSEKPSLQFCTEYDISAHWVVADLTRAGTFTKIYGEIRPDIVFNLAGYGVAPSERNEELARALNVDLVHEITDVVSVDHAVRGRVRLVHAGSAAEYGRVPAGVTEASPTAPSGLYGRTKLEGTLAVSRACRRSGSRMTTARLFTVYGPGERLPRLLPSLLQAAERGEDLPLTEGLQQRDFTFVGDVAEGLLRLGVLTTDPPDVVNLATGELNSVRDFAQCVAELLGLRPLQLKFGALPQRQDETPHGPVDTSLLEGVLKWVPSSSMREGIRQTIEFYAATRHTLGRQEGCASRPARHGAPK